MSRNVLALCVIATFTYLVFSDSAFPRRVHDVPVPSPWEVYEVENGNRYYYNPQTQQSTWDPPPPAPLPPPTLDPSLGYPGPSGRYIGSLSLLFTSVDVIVDIDGATRTFHLRTEGFHTMKKCGPVAYTLDLDEEKGTYSGTIDASRGPPASCIVRLLRHVDGVLPDVVWDGRHVPDTVMIHIKGIPLIGTYTLRLENKLSQAQEDL